MGPLGGNVISSLPIAARRQTRQDAPTQGLLTVTGGLWQVEEKGEKGYDSPSIVHRRHLPDEAFKVTRILASLVPTCILPRLYNVYHAKHARIWRRQKKFMRAVFIWIGFANVHLLLPVVIILVK